MNQRSWLGIRFDALVRVVMWRTLSARMPLYLVAEYPRSGGTWFSQMLADYLQVPFPRDRLPILSPCVMHGHHVAHPAFRNVFCVLRDGRDAVVSEYFHMLLSDHNYRHVVQGYRSELPFADYEDVRTNLPRFIEYLFTKHDAKWSRFTWSQFVRSWVDQEAEIVRYEELLAGAGERLGRAVHNVLGVEPDTTRLEEIQAKYSFENMARRKPGQENTRSFLRKGVAGDWRGKLSREARQVFDHYAGDELILAGYEPDRSWVNIVADADAGDPTPPIGAGKLDPARGT